MIRDAVLQLQQLGPLPSEGDMDKTNLDESVALLQEYEAALKSIETPVTDEEARILVTLFPPAEDSCFGLAESILHAVETAPGWPLEDCLQDETSYWIQTLNIRIENARKWGLL